MNLVINGFCGKMGQVIYNLAKKDKDFEVKYGVDRQSSIAIVMGNFTDVRLVDNLFKVRECDVVIDFSHASSLEDVLNFCVINRVPLVVATTGHSVMQERAIIRASKIIPIFKSGNFSEGINVMLSLISLATKGLKDFDIEIIEKHHNKKVDVPSGTAQMLINTIREQRQNSVINLGRSSNGKRTKEEIGVHSIRGGGLIGEHTVYFLNDAECLSITHTAFSRDVFGIGALHAAKFLVNKEPGLYGMKNLFE